MTDELVGEIVQTIADAENVEPHRLEMELQQHIATEAIQQLEAHDRDSWKLEFETPRHAITITEDNTVLVDGQ